MGRFDEYRIVIRENAAYVEKKTAEFLRQTVRLVSGASIPIVTDREAPTECEFVLGVTNREALDGVSFNRSGYFWEHELKVVGKRVYMTGHSIPAEADADNFFDNRVLGTSLAVYRFIDTVIGYNFVFATYDGFPEKTEFTLDESINYIYTYENIDNIMPELIDGTSMHLMRPSWSHVNASVIFKLKNGKFVVVDGGNRGDCDKFLRSLEHLSEGKKPVIEAMFISHLHPDHYGVLQEIVEKPEFSSRVIIKNVYHRMLMSTDYYVNIAPDRDPIFENAWDKVVHADKYIDTNVRYLSEGEVFDYDDITVKVVHTPRDEDIPLISDINDTSVVYKVTHKESGQTIMLIGDAEEYSSNDMLKNHLDDLESDVVQIGHHGCGNVSGKCYAAMNGKLHFFQTSKQGWYSDSGSGVNTYNPGGIRTRYYLREMGAPVDKIITDLEGTLSFKLPIDI